MRSETMILKAAGIGGFALALSLVVATATAQQVRTTSIPFNGLMAQDGKVELILRLYDRADGGTKLFEETAVVEVSHGVYFTLADVPSEVIARHSTVWLEVARKTNPSLRIEARQAFALRRAENDVQATTCPVGGCASLCYSCGGEYPFFNGSIPLPAGSMPTERGSGCAEPLAAAEDTAPYLCTQ